MALLADLFPESAHVRQLGLDRSTDTVIWNYAKQSGFFIVTFDSDYVERTKLFGTPPKVIWLRCGNTTTAMIEAILRRHATAILDLAREASPSYLELF